jgi:small subunit ribosomal protein S13
MFLDSRKITITQSIKNAFRQVKGVGVTRLNVLLRKANINRKTYLKSIDNAKRKGLAYWVAKNYTTGGTLKRFELTFLKPHLLYGSYKGIRMSQGLPSNGQRTHSNASTASKMPRLIIDNKKTSLSNTKQKVNTKSKK